MDLKGEQIKDTYGNLLTIGTVAGTPTTGTVQNGDGSDVTDLTLNGIISVGDGAVGTPSIANAGDTDTGLWFPADNVIAVSTQGAEAARVSANGTVAVGGTATNLRGAPDANGTLYIDDVVVLHQGTNKVYTAFGQPTPTTGTIVYTFSDTTSSSSARATSYVKLTINGAGNSNTQLQRFAAEYHFVLFKNNAAPNVTVLLGQSSIYEYGISYATDVAFADSGSGVCTLTITNPSAASPLYFGTKVEIQSGYNAAATNNNGFNLTSIVIT